MRGLGVRAGIIVWVGVSVFSAICEGVIEGTVSCVVVSVATRIVDDGDAGIAVNGRVAWMRASTFQAVSP